MSAPEPRHGPSSPGGSPVGMRGLRLRRRRRGWAWTAACSPVGLAAYIFAAAHLFNYVTGPLFVIAVIPMFVLLALIPAGLVAVIADTARLHHLDAAAEAGPPSSVLDAALGGQPARRRRSRMGWFAWVVLVTMVLPAPLYLPRQVNAMAYLAGFGHQDMFVPTSYSQACGKTGCSTVTDGFLNKNGESLIWPDQVPLGQSFIVWEPVWPFGTGRDLVPGVAAATARTGLGLFFDLMAAFVALAVIGPRARHRLARPTAQTSRRKLADNLPG